MIRIGIGLRLLTRVVSVDRVDFFLFERVGIGASTELRPRMRPGRAEQPVESLIAPAVDCRTRASFLSARYPESVQSSRAGSEMAT